MSTPKFSIIIPIYNAETSITKTIKVLKEFDNANFEILLVNDGSTDSTEKVVNDSIGEDPRFHLFTKKNEGPGLARNYGIERARGDYLLFFDADDYPEKTILNDYALIISNNPRLDLIVSSFIFRTMNQEKVADEKEYLVTEHIYDDNEEFLTDMYELMNKQLMYVVWNKCYRRDLIIKNKIRFKDYRSCEDRIFNLDYYKHCSLVVMNPKVEYVYEFVGGQGITNQYNQEKFATFKEFYERGNAITNNEIREGMAALLLKGATSVIFSILETEKITRKQKKIEIDSILNDTSIVEAKQYAITDTTTKKITKLLFNMPRPLLLFVFNIGAFIETKMPGVMALLKRNY
ncbi:glycosyltransferase family 2 protein [Enterococcus sp. AZ186]|uniref:glycosyltransferase family 2 protein n=1 Tax=Enterococcus sp. AZ186 TaxID=2774632 RepID=UPI003F1EB58B